MMKLEKEEEVGGLRAGIIFFPRVCLSFHSHFGLPIVAASSEPGSQ